MQETVSRFQFGVNGVEAFEFGGLGPKLCNEAVDAVGVSSGIVIWSLSEGLLVHTRSCGLHSRSIMITPSVGLGCQRCERSGSGGDWPLLRSLFVALIAAKRFVHAAKALGICLCGPRRQQWGSMTRRHASGAAGA